MNHEEFTRKIQDEMKHFHRLSITHMNAEHFVYNQPGSMLPETVQRLLMFLLNELMPFGILNFEQLNNAHKTLETIEQRLSTGADVTELSNQFYEMIPHDGISALRPLLNTAGLCNSKKNLIDRLRSQLEPLHAGLASDMNPLDYFSRFWLKTQLKPLEHSTDEFRALEMFVKNTQHANDDPFFVIENIFKIYSTSQFEANDEDDCYLVHATHLSNVFGILRDGLMISPGHLHRFGNRLGKGIYFSDVAAIALSRHQSAEDSLLFVCRVRLGKVKCIPSDGHFDRKTLPSKGDGFDSILSFGAEYSNVVNETMQLNGASISCGRLPSRDSSIEKMQAWYNRYMVFDSDQVKVEYLLHLKKSK